MKSGGSAQGAISRRLMWTSSAAGRRAAQRAAEKSLAARKEAPRCGARRKQDGGPCEGLALDNGRCRLHGGLTPKGDQWHRVQAPKTGAHPEKSEKKLRELERRERRRRARVDAMSPEERATYEKRRQAARPRSSTARAQERQDRDAATLLGAPRTDTQDAPEMARLRAELAALDDEKAQLEAWLAENEPDAKPETGNHNDQ